MLLTSSEDKNSSLSANLLQGQECDILPKGHSDIEADRSTRPLSTAKQLESDRARTSVSTQESFDAPEVYLSVRHTNGSSAVVQPFHRQDLPLKNPQLPKTEPDGLYALRRAARLKARRKPQASSQDRGALAKLLESNKTESRELDSYAAPLAPLRERDLQALSALFQRDDMYAIEVDVSHRLLSLLPEPYWEDDAFAFLQEFL